MPILRSQQQGEILALLLGDPDLELSLTDIAARSFQMVVWETRSSVVFRIRAATSALL